MKIVKPDAASTFANLVNWLRHFRQVAALLRTVPSSAHQERKL
jgi:hypothetical protein